MDMDITVRHRFLWKTWTTMYRGSCTVWHNLETGRRCSTGLEMQLCDIWWKRKNDS